MPYETEITEELMRKNRKSPWIIVVVILAILMVLAAGGFVGHHVMKDRAYDKAIALGDKYMKEDNYEEAILAYQKSVQIKEREPVGLEKLADAYKKNDQPAEAAEVYDKLFSYTGKPEYEKKRNTAQEEEKQKQANAELFKELSGTTFIFSSGAGGWGTMMEIKEDGTFSGTFHDSDMGDIGEGYPNGTLYQSEFSGKFKDVEKVGDYEYTMTLDGNMKLKNKPETTEVKDETRIIYAEPYGMDGLKDGDKVKVFAPGYPTSKFAEEERIWIMYAEEGSELEHYCIENGTQIFYSGEE